MNIENTEFYNALNPAEQAAVEMAYAQLPNPPYSKTINKQVMVTWQDKELHYKVTFIGKGDSLVLQPLEIIQQ
ncbi:MAG: hypothetical protein M3Q05_08095 [Bacteroidota bacterium]|nr:hypothetical protein [Bacteroidota bacterium]